MKTVIACAITALIVVAGAGAYNAAVTPGQFNSLKQQVNSLRSQVSGLQTRVTTLESTSANTASLNTLTTCLKTNWNAIEGFNPNTYAVNGTVYSSSAASVAAFAGLALVYIKTANWTTC